MRLVSYNILEGLRPLGATDAERRLLDRARAKAAQDVVHSLSPDILVLNEALFCQQFAGKFVDYGTLFGFEFSVVALYDQAWGNAILSRWPVVTSREVRIKDRGGLVAVLDTPDGHLAIASYHPHPAREPELRVEDYTRLVQGVTGPLVVCGDLNAIHPDDPIDIDALVDAFRAFSATPQLAVQSFVRSGLLVFEALAALGLHDAIPAAGRRYTIPTDLVRGDKRSAMRIDHILCNAQVIVVSGEVVHSAATNRASDHHPVMLDFSL